MRKLFLAAAIAWTVFLTVLCLVRMETLGPVNEWEIPYKDKWGHLVFYFVFTVLWFLYFRYRAKTSGKSIRAYALLAAFIYGSLVEVCQYLFTDGRSADIVDVLFNTIGSAIAILVIWLICKNRK